MKSFSRTWCKAVLIIITSVVLNMILHGLLSPISSSETSYFEPSFFVKKGLLIPAIIVWELLTFGIFSLVYILIQFKLPGNRRTKGFLYGLCFGGLYFIGMFEMVLIANSSLYSELLMGLTDCFSFVISGILLGTFIGTDDNHNIKRQGIGAIFVIAALYVTGRYFEYSVLHVNSTYMSKPIETLIWTICLGLWVGVIYFVLQPGIKGRSVISQGLFFGLIVFGSSWLMNHLFIDVVIAEFSFDLLIRAGTDMVFTIIGVCLCKKLLDPLTNSKSVVH